MQASQGIVDDKNITIIIGQGGTNDFSGIYAGPFDPQGEVQNFTGQVPSTFSGECEIQATATVLIGVSDSLT